jgi:Holliday junction resolvase RusA-like endonuclease
MITTFTVDGRVRGKGRPRVRRDTGRFYTPKLTVEYQRAVAWEASRARPKKWPLDKSTLYHVRIFIGHGGGHLVDVDNASKAILDACEGILWPNDRQVESLCIYRARGTVHGVRVEVSYE